MSYRSTAVWSVYPGFNGAAYVTITGAVNAHHISLTMGSPGLKRHLLKYSATDGGIDQGFALEPRKAVWELFIQADTEADFEAKRENIYRLFKPYDGPIYIKVAPAGGGTAKILECIVDGPVDFQQSLQLGYSTIVRVPLYCPNPLWRHDLTTTITDAFSGFNMSYTYGGDYDDWPIIEIRGQVQDPVLNTTTTTAYRTEEAWIDLTGVTIPDMVTWTIDMRPGKKTVIGASGANQIDKMVDDRWVNFKTWPAPYRSAGVNIVGYTYTTKNFNALLSIISVNRFLSY